MNRRVPSLLFAAAVAIAAVGFTAAPVSADPPPWSAAYHKKAHKHAGRYCNHPSHAPAGYGYGRPAPYGGGYGVYGRTSGYDPVIYERCGHILEKVHRARSGLARWSGTGRHEDAQRYWRNYLRTAPRRLEECRAAAYRNDGYYAGRYGYPDDDDFYYDRDYPYGQSFDLKRDWPYLLGGLLGQGGMFGR